LPRLTEALPRWRFRRDSAIAAAVSPKVNHMRFFLTLLFVLALSIHAEAQQPKKIPRIGYLTIGYAPTEARRAPLREAFTLV